MTKEITPRRILIVAVDSCGGISRSGNIPWDVPEDMMHFRKSTMGYPVIMGRTTYKTIGRPLKGRHTIILTRLPDCIDHTKKESFYDSRWEQAIRKAEENGDKFTAAYSIEEAFDLVKDDPIVYIAGGLSIYEQAMKYCNEMVVTTIKEDFNCDQIFTAQMDKWRVARYENFRSELAELDYRITTFERVAPDDETKQGDNTDDNQTESPDVPDSHPDK